MSFPTERPILRMASRILLQLLTAANGMARRAQRPKTAVEQGGEASKLKELRMHTHQKSADPVATIGLDIGKNTFHLVGLDKRGGIAPGACTSIFMASAILRRFSRLAAIFARISAPLLVPREAVGGS
jgi:hypothetical protein